jgi:hypothetical protein
MRAPGIGGEVFPESSRGLLFTTFPVGGRCRSALFA